MWNVYDSMEIFQHTVLKNASIFFTKLFVLKNRPLISQQFHFLGPKTDFHSSVRINYVTKLY